MGGARERAVPGTPLSSSMPYLRYSHSWRDCNTLTIKLAPPSDDDHSYGTLGHLWARDVASVTSQANILRCIALPQWLILKCSPEFFGWNEKDSHLLKYKHAIIIYGYRGSYFARFEVFRGCFKFRFRAHLNSLLCFRRKQKNYINWGSDLPLLVLHEYSCIAEIICAGVPPAQFCICIPTMQVCRIIP